MRKENISDVESCLIEFPENLRRVILAKYYECERESAMGGIMEGSEAGVGGAAMVDRCDFLNQVLSLLSY